MATAAYTLITGNTFPVKDALKAMGARWDSYSKGWMVPSHRAAEAQALLPAPVQRAQATAVGSLQGLFGLFAAAKASKLKHPHIHLTVGGTATMIDGKPRIVGGKPVKLTVAGPQSKNAGSINLTNGIKFGYPGAEWYGTVTPSGDFQPSRSVTPELAGLLLPLLQGLASDPVATVRLYGGMSGQCMFCNATLDDDRSLAVGAGPICASKWGMAEAWKNALKVGPLPVAAAL
jgi:hypothetical protein